MSFRNPFAKTNVRKSAISKTEEREFEQEVKRIEQLDENTRRLYKDMKRCVEAQTSYSKSEVKTSSEFASSALVREDEGLRAPVDLWSSACQRLEMHSHDNATVGSKTVVEPMKKLASLTPSVNNAVKRRELALQEYNKWQAKVEKYQERERTGPNIVKMDNAKKYLNATKNDYDAQHQALMEDLPRLYQGRADYCRPTLQALVQAQVRYYTEAHKIYSELFSSLADAHEYTEDTAEYTQRMRDKLAEIRALSITVDE